MYTLAGVHVSMRPSVFVYVCACMLYILQEILSPRSHSHLLNDLLIEARPLVLKLTAAGLSQWVTALWGGVKREEMH